MAKEGERRNWRVCNKKVREKVNDRRESKGKRDLEEKRLDGIRGSACE